MSKHFTPLWKDDKGNILFFAAENTLFDSAWEAKEWQIGEWLNYIPLGLSPANDGETLEVEVSDEGKARTPHVKVSCGGFALGGMCIRGPLFEAQTG